MRDAPVLAVSGGRSRPDGPPKPRPSAARKNAKAPSLLRRAFARPGVTVAGAAFAAVMTGIVANAMLFQKGHHPSPLFAEPRDVAAVPTPPAVPRARASAPEPTIAPAPLPAVSPDPPAAAAPPPSHGSSVAVHHAKPVHATAKPHADPIGALLGHGGTKPAGTGPAHATAVARTPAAPAPEKSVNGLKARPAVASTKVAPHLAPLTE